MNPMLIQLRLTDVRLDRFSEIKIPATNSAEGDYLVNNLWLICVPSMEKLSPIDQRMLPLKRGLESLEPWGKLGLLNQIYLKESSGNHPIEEEPKFHCITCR